MRACGVLLLVAATLWTWLGVAHAAPCDKQLPAEVARRVLHQEPYDLLEELGQASDDQGALTRTFLSQAHQLAAGQLVEWMAQAGMAAWVDDVANVHGRAPGVVDNATALLVGSHYDTVVDGGKYDGALGIVAGICAVKARVLEETLCQGNLTEEQLLAAVANAKGPLDVRSLLGYSDEPPALLPGAVHVVGFSDEEGIRFQSTFLGSRAVAGQLGDILSMKDADGQSIRQALQQEGYELSEASIKATQLPKDRVRGYVEVHIEQGPVLEGQGQPIGVVSAIAGQTRLYASIGGEQGHAGTVPMSMRKDPMVGAAWVIAHLAQLCSPHLEANKHGNLVCTVGAIHVYPNAGNVIPRWANFTIDIRSQHDDNRKHIVHQISAFVTEVCGDRHLECSVEKKNEAASVHAHPDLTKAFADASKAALASFKALKQQGGEAEGTGKAAGEACGGGEGSEDAACEADYSAAPVLVSGAGHDAMVMAGLTKMGMLFVRCRGGISHSPEEFASQDDVAVGTLALKHLLAQEQ